MRASWVLIGIVPIAAVALIGRIVAMSCRKGRPSGSSGGGLASAVSRRGVRREPHSRAFRVDLCTFCPGIRPDPLHHGAGGERHMALKPHHSLRTASAGSMPAARQAGRMPNPNPTAPLTQRAKTTKAGAIKTRQPV